MLFIRLLTPACCLLFSVTLTAQTANRFDIVINELFPDPSPPVQLPNSEFIELKNTSLTPLNIRNWQLSNGNTTATVATNCIIQPDSFVIICSQSAVSAYTIFGTAIGVSNFPGLNNEAGIISLYSAEGRLIHSVTYNNNWYQNGIKSEGGWTLEMVDPKNPCTGAGNWKASTDNQGGTPGKKNSVDGINHDNMPPALQRTYTTDSTTIIAVFDEPLDSTSASMRFSYHIDNGIGIPVAASPLMPLYNEVTLQLPAALNNHTVYRLTAGNVNDCAGNSIGQVNTVKAGLPVIADSLGIIINEVLFNPPSNGYDYIELYNRSNRVIDLKQLYLCNRNGTGQFANITRLSTVPYLLFPGEYIAFTENKQWVQQQYLVNNSSHVIELSSLPSLPDDKGDIVLTNAQGSIIDELPYDEKWHFALIENKEGIALERINYNQPTRDKQNWMSAASTAGFGTPGYQNSQFRADLQAPAQVMITPKIFSPDNDGLDDFATIQYQLTEPGYVANIAIFDANGRRVRYLVQNATLASTGRFRWDGLDDKLNKLPIGMYIVLTEIFNLQGKTKKFKQVVSLARK